MTFNINNVFERAGADIFGAYERETKKNAQYTAQQHRQLDKQLKAISEYVAGLNRMGGAYEINAKMKDGSTDKIEFTVIDQPHDVTTKIEAHLHLEGFDDEKKSINWDSNAAYLRMHSDVAKSHSCISNPISNDILIDMHSPADYQIEKQIYERHPSYECPRGRYEARTLTTDIHNQDMLIKILAHEHQKNILTHKIMADNERLRADRNATLNGGP